MCYVLIKWFIYNYFGMNTSFRISLLYLLLLIPHHGNSPLPVMESWLKKDQDDGFIQRDMTSSLTGGDESFGSAHQTYQNSLIRKKKSDKFGNSLPATNYRNLGLKYDKDQQYTPNTFFKSHYLNKEYSAPGTEKEKSNIMYGNFEDSKFPYSKFLAGTLDLKSSLADPLDTSPLDIGNDKRNFLKDSVKFSSSRSSLHSDNEESLNPFEDFGKGVRWSMSKRLKARYAPNPFSKLLQSVDDQDAMNFDDNTDFQNDYSLLEDQQIGNPIRNQEYRDSFRPGGRSTQIFDENEYYEVEANPMNLEGDLNLEEDSYNQILNEHALMHKRDDRKQVENYPNTPNSGVDIGKNSDSSKAYTSDSSPLESALWDLKRIKKSGFRARQARENKDITDPELMWKISSNLQNKELDQVMKNSQKTLQEAQKIQQKFGYKGLESNESEGYKRPIRGDSFSVPERFSVRFDNEKRLKREDEDEQKNMKTGTDEGGGGEYEDEEGKGHNDEEEYYEDADLSNDESGVEMRKAIDENQKYVKREAVEETGEKNDDNDEDYELNLDNALVENDEKSKKVSYRENNAFY